MFATLGGALPPPPPPDHDALAIDESADAGGATRALELRLERVVRDQVEAGLEPVCDSGLTAGASTSAETSQRGLLVERWRRVAGLTDRAVKQSLTGPYTLGWTVEGGPTDRVAATLASAEALNAELAALVAAGCPLIEVVEDDATRIGDSVFERRLYAEAQRRLLAGVQEGPHLSLAIRGGNADTAGASTILDAPYSSYLFDLCAGPDNWRLVVEVPTDRGVIVGAADARTAARDELELLAFAIGYAASTRGRGHDRVGVATSGDMTSLDYPTALAKMQRIGEIAGLYAGPPGTLAKALDPRAIDARSAGLGRYAPGPAVLGRDRPRPAPGRRKRRSDPGSTHGSSSE